MAPAPGDCSLVPAVRAAATARRVTAEAEHADLVDRGASPLSTRQRRKRLSRCGAFQAAADRTRFPHVLSLLSPSQGERSGPASMPTRAPSPQRWRSATGDVAEAAPHGFQLLRHAAQAGAGLFREA